ncbi:MAG TPA: Spy/CpxP family protein refolding chaperone [Gemmatimonadaceae bacterium]|jgi:periplasmic protein CpxP/Spy|nr:Spy/CpxP family protein refolding chaperone [Gemmatimonadaceae bacterium]
MTTKWLAVSLPFVLAGSLAAQSDPPRPSGMRPLARAAVRQEQQPNPRRQALVRQVRQAFARLVRKQLNLTDEQMQSLQRVDTKYEQQRRALLRDERQARLGLQAAMADSATADQSRIARQLDGLIQSQRKRADLLEAEQKELSSFLTPLQRAKYFAVRERLNRRLQELAQGDSAGGRGARARGTPPER